MPSVQPRCLHSGDKELRAICEFTAKAVLSTIQREEPLLTSSAISSGKITTLNHEILDDTMELAAFVTKPFLLGNIVRVQAVYYNCSKGIRAVLLWKLCDKAHTTSICALTSPVANVTKFSTVLGTVLPNRPTIILPTSSSPILMSK
uniref:Uncharacterized protein n=1 Tax=Scleropages formosus TaxID=113540 RepID=A0A8C9RPA2_SCLFO